MNRYKTCRGCAYWLATDQWRNNAPDEGSTRSVDEQRRCEGWGPQVKAAEWRSNVTGEINHYSGVIKWTTVWPRTYAFDGCRVFEGLGDER